MLAQLGLPPGRVQALYRPPQEVDPKDICRTCGGVGYYGRTAIYELLPINDAIREALLTNAGADAIRQAARAAGTYSLQQEGIVLVAKGVTSLPELMRVMKQ